MVERISELKALQLEANVLKTIKEMSRLMGTVILSFHANDFDCLIEKFSELTTVGREYLQVRVFHIRNRFTKNDTRLRLHTISSLKKQNI